MGSYGTRTRLNQVFTGSKGVFCWNGVPQPHAAGWDTPYIGLGRQTTTSRSNMAPSIRAAVFGDRGGDFYTTNHSYSGGAGTAQLRWYYPGYGQYPGYLYARTKSFGPEVFPVSTASLVFGLDAAGTTAIARCDPTKAAASTSQALAEIFRDGVPRLVGSTIYKKELKKYRRVISKSKRKASVLGGRKAADEYLNVEFGWKPLLSDVQKFATAVTESERILKQYHRNSGRTVRRRYTFPVETSVSRDVTSQYAVGWFPTISEGGYMTMGTMTKTISSTKRKWFSGAFTYHAPEGANDPFGKLAVHAQEANKLLGLGVTPETVWNVAPWSWAADWFGNVGDIAHNVSAMMTDGLVLRYGYIMEETIDVIDYQLDKIVYQNGGSGPSSLRQTFTTTVKQRRGCTPFGFGLSWSGFSPRQLALTAALGISQSSRLGY